MHRYRPAVYHGEHSENSIAIRGAMCREGPENSQELTFQIYDYVLSTYTSFHLSNLPSNQNKIFSLVINPFLKCKWNTECVLIGNHNDEPYL